MLILQIAWSFYSFNWTTFHHAKAFKWHCLRPDFWRAWKLRILREFSISKVTSIKMFQFVSSFLIHFETERSLKILSLPAFDFCMHLQNKTQRNPIDSFPGLSGKLILKLFLIRFVYCSCSKWIWASFKNSSIFSKNQGCLGGTASTWMDHLPYTSTSLDWSLFSLVLLYKSWIQVIGKTCH